MATVETRALRKEFTGHTAVDGVVLAIREGEFLVLLGPSGCGKTTLLRMIAGLETQTSGDILIGGRVVNELPPRTRKIAMVFQSYALYPHLSVAKNIAFPLKAQGAPRESIAGEVEKAAKMFGIERLLQRKPRQPPAASGSGWLSPGPWCATRTSSSSTSRSPTSTPSCAPSPVTS
jgi:multiple sugar transport system ATP-binding protein